MDVDPMSARESVRFQVGDVVLEVVGAGPDAARKGPPAKTRRTSIVAITADGVCMTKDGWWYDRLTGKLADQADASDPYRAIHRGGPA